MEALKLIGVLVVILGFYFKKDTIATVVVAGIVTGLVAGMTPMEILEVLGKSFITQRTATLFVLTLPVIGICERYGLKDKSVDFIRGIKGATTGKVLSLYQTIRAAAAAFSVRLGGHPQFIRPLVNPMAQAAAIAKHGELDDKTQDEIKGAAAASENYGNFFAQNVFMGASGTLLIVSTMAEQGFKEVTALNIAMWSIPVAVISVILGIGKNYLLDKHLESKSKRKAE
ncbi:DUF969 domain-containing protein [Proteiniclasticum sp. BAD-10]|uniref:DUF969 domain-containing protein n=1 Tax=Proteiniclasticum sediminis TaxID=2804028 RepID=A0A941CN41_9CLOT|nr:DUF969 domain-containing protein [Proteiniclasticum sediminis]MBR0575117.1 DUF969 domain-containing protein [Proteiniclasticum sediminis]